MEGLLYKWTNYITAWGREHTHVAGDAAARASIHNNESRLLNDIVTAAGSHWTRAIGAERGWQPRWFVLDNGVLSYYDSQDDVCKGSKGSIKMAACQIKVHPTDSSRMELIIPGEQHFYVRAVNAAERQRWLVALESSKTSVTDSRSRKEKEVSEANESLRTKMSELRLYCDLLMQQVHTIQEFASQEERRPPPENMNEASSLLSATCNTFISTLEECVKIANAKFKPEMYQRPPHQSMMSAVSPSPVQMMQRSMSHPGTRTLDRNNYSLREHISVHRTPHRRRSAYSDTEAASDGPVEDYDRPMHHLRVGMNGELPPSRTRPSTRSRSKQPSETEDSSASFSS